MSHPFALQELPHVKRRREEAERKQKAKVCTPSLSPLQAALALMWAMRSTGSALRERESERNRAAGGQAESELCSAKLAQDMTPPPPQMAAAAAAEDFQLGLRSLNSAPQLDSTTLAAAAATAAELESNK